MNRSPVDRFIDVLLFEGVNLLDVAGPVQAFDTARVSGRQVYRTRFLTVDGGSVRACCGMVLGSDGRLEDASPEGDLLIPGGKGVDRIVAQDAVLDAIRARTGRLISVCSGALVLAGAGVLDGTAATTHWSRDRQVADYPKVLWDLDRIFTRQGRVATSAGVTTGIDLALAIIRADCGSAVALAVARELVVQLRRTGGQSQYAGHLAAQFADDSLNRLVEAVIADPCRPWTLAELADEAGLHPRTLSRRSRQHLGMPPAEFVERIRVDTARALLEDRLPMKTVAARSGFGDQQRMRRAFMRVLKVLPADYAGAFVDA